MPPTDPEASTTQQITTTAPASTVPTTGQAGGETDASEPPPSTAAVTSPVVEVTAPLGLDALGVAGSSELLATEDPRGDAVLEQSASTAGGPSAGADIVAHVGLTASASQAVVVVVRNRTARIGGRVLCPFGAGPVPAGDLLIVAVLIEGGVAPTDDNYLYGLFLDADPAVANHRADPTFDWDFRQGTDQWYFLQMTGDPEDDLVVANRADDRVQGKAMYSAATVIVFDDTIVWVLPGDEIPGLAPSYRVSALRGSEPLDQQRDSSVSAGDVSGSDPTAPPIAISGTASPLEITDAIPPDVQGSPTRPTAGPGEADPTAFILKVLIADLAERINSIDPTADPADVARDILHPITVVAAGIEACADLTAQSYQPLTEYRIIGTVLGPDPTTILASTASPSNTSSTPTASNSPKS